MSKFLALRVNPTSPLSAAHPPSWEQSCAPAVVGALPRTRRRGCAPAHPPLWERSRAPAVVEALPRTRRRGSAPAHPPSCKHIAMPNRSPPGEICVVSALRARTAAAPGSRRLRARRAAPRRGAHWRRLRVALSVAWRCHSRTSERCSRRRYGCVSSRREGSRALHHQDPSFNFNQDPSLFRHRVQLAIAVCSSILGRNIGRVS